MTRPPRRASATGFIVALIGTTLAIACASNGKSDSTPHDAAATAGSGGGSGQGAGGTTATAGSGGSPISGVAGTTGGAGSNGQAGSNGSAGLGGSPGGASGTAGAGGAATSSGGAGARGGAAGGSAGATGSGGRGGAAGAQWQSAFPTFTRHTIATFSSGYTILVADIDHDGMPDVVALSSGADGLVWFKNPSWKKYTITKAKQLIYAAPYDVDGDGDVDLAIASDFDMNNTTGGGTVSWAENPADPTQSQDWALRKIDAVPTSHRLRWADLDGDGKKELIDLPIFGVGSSAPSHAGAVQLKAYVIPKDPKAASATWTAQVLDNQHLETAHGIAIVDWDGDKAEDILTAANDGVVLFRPSLGKGAEPIGAGATGQAPDKGSSEVVLGSLGGARFIATIEPWHGTDGVIYTPGASATALWARQDLGADFEHGHAMVLADFNGDGYDEVVGGGGQGTMLQLIYRYVPSSRTWEKIKLDMGGVAISGSDVADINGDGAPDIVAIGGSPTNNVVWYENSR